MGPQEFATNEYKEYMVYKSLSRTEKNETLKRILEHLKQHEKSHFEFWKRVKPDVQVSVSPWYVWWHRVLRNVLGVTFFVKYLERGEHQAIKNYETYLTTTDDVFIREGVQKIIDDEKTHEKEIIGKIQEEKVKFTGSIILGLNDGLIELTGALVGFTSAFNNSQFVALSGLITGISASLSMAASAYMQEKHDQDKNPKKAALYTGVSYIFVVIALIAPFWFNMPLYTALATSFVIVVLIVAGISYYSAVLFDWSFRKQFAQMFSFSIGVAIIAFLIGTLFKNMTGIEIG